jgi:hypothetical protein
MAADWEGIDRERGEWEVDMFVEFYDSELDRGRLIGCMDMMLVPQAGEIVEFLEDDESWGAFRVLVVKHDVRVMPISGGAYFRTDFLATKCCVSALGGHG